MGNTCNGSDRTCTGSDRRPALASDSDFSHCNGSLSQSGRRRTKSYDEVINSDHDRIFLGPQSSLSIKLVQVKREKVRRSSTGSIKRAYRPSPLRMVQDWPLAGGVESLSKTPPSNHTGGLNGGEEGKERAAAEDSTPQQTSSGGDEAEEEGGGEEGTPPPQTPETT